MCLTIYSRLFKSIIIKPVGSALQHTTVELHIPDGDNIGLSYILFLSYEVSSTHIMWVLFDRWSN